MKRFWDAASVAGDGGSYRVLLDGKPIHLPTGGVLHIGPLALAEAVAEEWRLAGGAKGGEMSFADTPLTRLAGTATARIAPDPTPTMDAIARYGETDLLCYRVETPRELAARQAGDWEPWLESGRADVRRAVAGDDRGGGDQAASRQYRCAAARGGGLRSLSARGPGRRGAGFG